jgi:glucosamine kinase
MTDTPYLVGVDGGGTRTTLALADADGREILRREGPAALVDPRWPMASAKPIVALLREATEAAGLAGPAAALCAGLAGVENAAERDAVCSALKAQGVAEQVQVVNDGEIALAGALGDGPGILLVAGTGSVAYGRGRDGRVERCGGWGMIVGDEGSGFGIGRSGARAALRGADGRGPATELLPRLLSVLRVPHADGIPPWMGRAGKTEVAALAVHVIELAEGGDGVAQAILRDAASDLAAHAVALHRRLGPWPAEVPVVFFGGVLSSPFYASLVARALADTGRAFQVRPARADAVAGAFAYARRMLRRTLQPA